MAAFKRNLVKQSILVFPSQNRLISGHILLRRNGIINVELSVVVVKNYSLQGMIYLIYTTVPNKSWPHHVGKKGVVQHTL